MAATQQPAQVVQANRIPPGARRANEEGQKYLKEALGMMEDRMSQIAPRHLNATKLMKIALLATSRNRTLGECTVNSILQSVMIAAYLGLECSGILGQGYLVPFWNSRLDLQGPNGRKGGYEATFIPGYRGLITLCRNSGGILDVSAQVVFQGDEINVVYGTDETIIHKPNMNIDREDGKTVVGAYMIALLAGGVKHPEYMNRSQLERRRNSTKSRNKEGEIIGPWKDWEVEMYRKCPIRSGVKTLPFSLEVNAAVQLENNLDDGQGGETVAQMLDLVPKLPNINGEIAPNKTTVPLNQQIKDARAKAAGTAADAPADDYDLGTASDVAETTAEPQGETPAKSNDLPPVEGGDVPGQMTIPMEEKKEQPPLTEEEALKRTRKADEQEPAPAHDISTWQSTYAAGLKLAKELGTFEDDTTFDLATRHWLVSIKMSKKAKDTTPDQRKAFLKAVEERTLEVPE